MLIRKLDGIAQLSDEERRAIAQLPVTVRPLGPHQDIVREKDKPSQCCLLLDGWACRYQILSEGKRQIFSFHIPGDIPDLHSLHMRVMDHGVCTLSSAIVAFVPHEPLRDLTAAFPGIAAILWRDTLVDAAIFRAWMTGLGRRTASEAVAHLFCELYLKLQAMGLARDHAYRLPLTQSEIGDALGLSNVHVNRTLRELRGKDWITLQGGRLEINKWQELANSCDFDPAYLYLERRIA
ncbi:Crp/Fnr family transcriptional regulator [Methylobacterium tarhaniae]|uniref:Crp/Fnr family transcriptional regulator n=1 Tax=Methylobacterium tarhaniae TaxID=1187852 RepID=A0A0J6TE29_9HYPH|nr:Crp/Fnr family transcriptional regulator [Methylobacterium tarhaniae]KMO44149.1 Crp/Fnr family transcriptional regulator [Methylobacterium tarhaniae]